MLFAEVCFNSKHLFLNVFNTLIGVFLLPLKDLGKILNFQCHLKYSIFRIILNIQLKNIEYSVSSFKLIKNFLCSNLLIHFRRIRTVLSSVIISDPPALNTALELRFNSVIANSTLKAEIQALFSFLWAYQLALVVKNCKRHRKLREVGLIPGLGRSPGEGNGNPLHSCLGNFMDSGAWGATVHEVAKSRTRLKKLSMQVLVAAHGVFVAYGI